jgi:hypothetical protein
VINRKAAEEARKQKEKDKKALKQARNKLRALCDNAAAGTGPAARLLSDDDTETLCSKMDCAALQQLCAAVAAEGERAAQEALLATAMDGVLGEAAAEIRRKEMLRKEAEAALQVSRALGRGPGPPAWLLLRLRLGPGSPRLRCTRGEAGRPCGWWGGGARRPALPAHCRPAGGGRSPPAPTLRACVRASLRRSSRGASTTARWRRCASGQRRSCGCWTRRSRSGRRARTSAGSRWGTR